MGERALTIDKAPFRRQLRTIRLFIAVLVDEDSDLLEIGDGHFQRAQVDCRGLQQILVVVILFVIGHHYLHQA